MKTSIFAVLFFVLVNFVAAQETQWSIEGIGITTDNCVVGCPCILGEEPTHGRCHFTGILLIQKGHYGDVVLDNAKIAVGGAFGRPKEMSEQQYDFIAFYIDKSAKEEQKMAIKKILKSSEFSIMGKPVEIKEVPITIQGEQNFGKVGKSYGGMIGDIAKLEITPISGAMSDKLLVIENSAEPLFYWTALGKSSKSYFKGAGQNWSFDGTSGESQRFSLNNSAKSKMNK